MELNGDGFKKAIEEATGYPNSHHAIPEKFDAKVYYALLKKEDPEYYKRRVREENVEALVIIGMVLSFVFFFLPSILLGALSCQLCGKAGEGVTSFLLKVKKLDQELVYGKDMTRL